jgi:hypothetical protein
MKSLIPLLFAGLHLTATASAAPTATEGGGTSNTASTAEAGGESSQRTAQPQVTTAESKLVPPSSHYHDGFYLRLALGGGYVHNSISNDNAGSMKVYGATIPLEILIGGSPAAGLAVGFGITANPMSKPKTEFEGQTMSVSSDYRVQYSRLGPFVDYYPNPSGNLHLLGSINYGGFTIVEDSTDRTVANAKGLALTAGVGYGLWVSSEWSIGILGQLSYAMLWAPNESHQVFAPTLMAEFTYH